MVSRTHLAVAMLALSMGALTAEAQQQHLPQPIVLYRAPANGAAPVRVAAPVRSNALPANSVTKNPATTGAVRPGMIVTNAAMAQQTGQAVVSQSGKPEGAPGNPAETKPLTPEQEWIEQQSRPTNQMLQNPSGGFNLSHSGFSNQQQTAPNSYFGQQFQNWTNQQQVHQMPASFGEMSRFQPGPDGTYVAPNTYLGSGFFDWSNLNQGGITPGATGSWSFSTWR